MASAPVTQFSRQVRPILSANHAQARRRVLSLYKLWIKQLPALNALFKLPYSEQLYLDKIRSEFRKNKHVTDLRVIDILLIKGQMELQEVINAWKPIGNILFYFKDTYNPKPKDFMGKFLAGHE